MIRKVDQILWTKHERSTSLLYLCSQQYSTLTACCWFLVKWLVFVMNYGKPDGTPRSWSIYMGWRRSHPGSVRTWGSHLAFHNEQLLKVNSFKVSWSHRCYTPHRTELNTFALRCFWLNIMTNRSGIIKSDSS